MEYIIDAKNKRLGRIASEIAVILQGKRNPAYEPRFSGGDRVLVKNAGLITLSGRKTKEKVYYKHTGPLGHLKVRSYEEMFKKNPGLVLRHAVGLMLPKNRLRKERMKRLVIE